MLNLALKISLWLAQPLDSSGVYLTAKDFEQHHLSYVVPGASFLVRALIHNSRVEITLANGRVIHLSVDSLYGIHRKGYDYRYIHYHAARAAKLDEAFLPVLAKAPVIIYAHRYIFSAAQLFFSTTPNGALHLLSVKNLAKQFPGQPDMIREIDQDKRLSFSMGARDPDGQLRVVKILANYLPAPSK